MYSIDDLRKKPLKDAPKVEVPDIFEDDDDDSDDDI
jgi:hypothetical protein